MSFTVKTAAATIAVAVFAVAVGKAQEVEFDAAQAGDFTKQVSIELNTDIAAPTRAMEAKFAEVEEKSTIKPDMRFARNDDVADEEPVQVAANW